MNSTCKLAALTLTTLLLASPAHAQAVIRGGVLEAQAAYGRKDYAAAVAAASRVLASRPRDPIALAWRAAAQVELGDYRRAIADYDASLALAPGSANALASACWARALAGVELERARALCDRAVAGGPSPTAHDTRGFLRLRQGQHALAVADYDAALGLQSGLATALYGRGVAKQKLGRDGRADIVAATKRDADIAATFARRGVPAR